MKIKQLVFCLVVLCAWETVSMAATVRMAENHQPEPTASHTSSNSNEATDSNSKDSVPQNKTEGTKDSNSRSDLWFKYMYRN